MPSRNCPVYQDGVMRLYEVKQETIPGTDAKRIVLVDSGMDIQYRELAVFDHLRTNMEQTGKEVTLKIRIPEYRRIDSHCYVCISGTWHRVYNVAHVTANGFRESELTLIAPESMYPIVEAES